MTKGDTDTKEDGTSWH